MKRIIFIQYTNPAAYPPLEHSSRILAQAGWQVLFLGTNALGADALRFPDHERIAVRQMKFCVAGWRQKLHYLCYCLWVIFWALRRRPSWVYASDPLSCPVALLLSFLPGLRLIYHEHDSPNVEQRAGSPEGGARLDVGTKNQLSEISSRRSITSKFMRLVLSARRQLARRAQLCVFPNEKRAERFAVQVSNPMISNPRSSVVVWNCPSIEDVSWLRARPQSGALWVLYHGSIVPSRLPLTVLQALVILPEAIKLRIIGYETVGDLGYVEELRVHVKRLGLIGRVEFLGTVPRADLLQWCRTSDVGLALLPNQSEDINQQAMVGASNKPFEYLASGLALVVSDLPDWRRIYVDSGYGLACNPDKPESIATALRWFADHPGETRAMGERGRQRIASEWNYEAQFSQVFEQITDQLHRDVRSETKFSSSIAE